MPNLSCHSSANILLHLVLGVPEYFWYDPFNPKDWAGFAIAQRVYQPLIPNDRDQLVSESLG